MSTSTNTCQLIVKSMKWCQGKTVKPGIRRRAFAISLDQVIKFPSYTRDQLGRVKSAMLQGNFQLVEDAKWAVIEHLPAKAEFKSEVQGEYPSQTFKVNATLVHPGVGKEAAEATASFLNSNCIFLVEDMDGNFRLIGSEDYDSVTTSSRDNGQGPTGTAGTTINIEASMEFDAPIYTGKIVTEDGTINEDSDIFQEAERNDAVMN